MTIDITLGDIITAKKRSEVGAKMPGGKHLKTHLWHNPIAIALERAYGGYAVVTDERLFVSGPTFSCACILTESGRAYLKTWREGVALPNYGLFVAVGGERAA